MIIFRTLPVALSISVLVLAILGVVLTPIGWRVSEFVFISDAQRDHNPLLAEMAENNRSFYSGVFHATKTMKIPSRYWALESVVRNKCSNESFSHSIQYSVAAVRYGNFSIHWFGSLWSILVWSFLGVGITRVCLLRLTRDERAGLDDAFEYSLQKFLTAMLAISLPMLAVFLFCIPTFLMGLVMGFDMGTVIIGIFWFVVLALATVMCRVVGRSAFWLATDHIECRLRGSKFIRCHDTCVRLYVPASVELFPLHRDCHFIWRVLLGDRIPPHRRNCQSWVLVNQLGDKCSFREPD